MAQNRCPICGEKILSGECIGCGYRLPDEDKLSAPYNLDPEDDRPEAFAPDPHKYEMPSAEYGGKTAVGCDERQDMPNIKVMPTNNMPANNNANQNGNWQNPYNYVSPPANNANSQTGGNNTANNTGWQNPYNYNPGGANNNKNPYSGANTDKEKLLTVGLVFMAITAFFLPIMAIAGIIAMNSAKNMDPKKRLTFKVLFIIALLAGFSGNFLSSFF